MSRTERGMGRCFLAVLSLLALIAFTMPAHAAPEPAEAVDWGRIELVRDRWGMAHIFATTDEGAMYGLGYAMAEDRGFQMNFNLLMIEGRMAEVFGDRRFAARNRSTIEHDRMMRHFGFTRAAREVVTKLEPETLALLDAFCRGVNDYFAANADRLHPLFDQLGMEPATWKPEHCILSAWHIGQYFATDGTRDLISWRNRHQDAARRAEAQDPNPLPAGMLDDRASAVVQLEDIDEAWLKRVHDFARQHGLVVPDQPDAGEGANNPEASPRFSHTWVVGREKTTTGSAVLVSDPQTPIRNPSIWYEFHIQGRTFACRGIGVPGAANLLIGWNRDVAWGATALGADQADLFRLDTDPDRPDVYRVDGRWEPFETIVETIKVRGGRDIELPVQITRFGPVVTLIAFAAPGDPEVALRRVPVHPLDHETLTASFAMMRAADLESFGKAVAGWRFPSMNVVAGDRQGNIGFWLAARFPLRSAKDEHFGAMAADGSQSAMDWHGFIPHELLPFVINPKRGWIASANHRAFAPDHPLLRSRGGGGHTLRSWRLYELLSAREEFTPEQVLDIHWDTVNPARRDFVRLAIHLRDRMEHEFNPDASRALRALDAWYRAGARSDLRQPHAQFAAEINLMFRPPQTPLAARWGGGQGGLSLWLRHAIKRIEENPAARLDRDEIAYIEQVLTECWRRTRQAGEGRGEAPARGRGDPGIRAPGHPRIMGWFDNLAGFGSLEERGDLAIPRLRAFDQNTILSQPGQSYTQFVPLHDVDQAQSLLPPGHRDRGPAEQRGINIHPWAEAQLRPAPMSREAVNRIAASTRELTPR
ncbi:MAG: penicillin acylase family protein [Phycisphaeraceae bacterium]|nr:penicillin acylase family protein [Phycisphaeraceae bacterium]